MKSEGSFHLCIGVGWFVIADELLFVKESPFQILEYCVELGLVIVGLFIRKTGDFRCDVCKLKIRCMALMINFSVFCQELGQ